MRVLVDRVVAPQLLEINVTVINTNENYKMGEKNAFSQVIHVSTVGSQ